MPSRAEQDIAEIGATAQSDDIAEVRLRSGSVIVDHPQTRIISGKGALAESRTLLEQERISVRARNRGSSCHSVPKVAGENGGSADAGAGVAAAVTALLPSPPDGSESQSVNSKDPSKSNFKAEMAVAAAVLVFLAMGFLTPYSSDTWFVWAHTVVLISSLAALYSWYIGVCGRSNTSCFVLRFLTSDAVFWECLILSCADLFRTQAWPRFAADRVRGVTVFIYRIAFFCHDALEHQTRVSRLGLSMLFLIGNVIAVYQAYFVDEAVVMYRVPSNNATVTTASARATVGQLFISVCMESIIVVVMDTEGIYIGLVQSYLPKFSLDVGTVTNAAELAQLVETHARAARAWRSWPTKSECLCLASLFVYLFSMAVGSTGLWADPETGSESSFFIALCAIPNVLLWVSFSCMAWRNISWPRASYCTKSPPVIMLMFYNVAWTVICIAYLNPRAPVSGAMGAIFVCSSLTLSLFFEAMICISRSFRMTMTCSAMLGFVMGIFMSVFVYTYDPEITELGSTTKLSVARTCFLNLAVLLCTSITTLLKDWNDGAYMALAMGYVLREEVLASEGRSKAGTIDGHAANKSGQAAADQEVLKEWLAEKRRNTQIETRAY